MEGHGTITERQFPSMIIFFSVISSRAVTGTALHPKKQTNNKVNAKASEKLKLFIAPRRLAS